jgi:hypothetical protein
MSGTGFGGKPAGLHGQSENVANGKAGKAAEGTVLERMR